MIRLKQLQCKRCGYGTGDHPWIPRVEDPKVCPNCKSPYWNVPRKAVKGLDKK